MFSHSWKSHTRLALAALVLVAGHPGARRCDAGQAQMKSGFVVDGKTVPLQGLTKALAEQSGGPTTTYPILMVDNGRQRIFMPARQTSQISETADLSRFETFKLPQKLSGRKLMVASVGGFEASPFDEWGRRSITLNTSRGTIAVVQGITEITPNHVKVIGLTHTWENALATTSIPPATLDAMLRKATKADNPDDRLAIARFYLQAGLYLRAGDELDSIRRDFPELKATVQESTVQLQQLLAKQLLGELRHRKSAGQYRLAYDEAKGFPVEGMGSDVLREVRELILAHEKDEERIEKAIDLIAQLQAKLDDSRRAASAGPIRSAIAESLDSHSLERLDAFLKLESDGTLSAAEKLALAYSGWILGSANAGTDFDGAVRLWNARHLVLEYLRTEDADARSKLLDALRRIEGFGPKSLLMMIPQLPPPVETPGLQPSQSIRIEIPGKKDGEAAAAYYALLPEEYSPNRAYPLIIALQQIGRPPEHELAWWGKRPDGKPGQSQRHGYIVIAPEWAGEKQREYDYGAQSHLAVLRALRDARQRFHIDSNRIFLSGHGAGGDAAFDMGMSHPDLFAGVIPIVGVSDKYCKWYWQNAKHTAWYVVTGELDRDSMARNSRDMNRMLKYGYDLVYAEYSGRGFESYYEEIHRLFDWMDLHRREAEPREIDVKVLRPTDNRFFWLQANGLPASVSQAAVLADDGNGKSRVQPMNLTAKATEGNSIYINSGSPSHTLWLSPGVVDFEKRVAIRHNGRQKFNDFLEPSLATILEDLRQRGDRQRLYQVQVEVD